MNPKNFHIFAGIFFTLFVFAIFVVFASETAAEQLNNFALSIAMLISGVICLAAAKDEQRVIG